MAGEESVYPKEAVYIRRLLTLIHMSGERLLYDGKSCAPRNSVANTLELAH